MLTRKQAHLAGITIIEQPLPTSSRKTSRKITKKRANSDNIEADNIAEVLAEIAALPDPRQSITKKVCSNNEKKDVEKPIVLLNTSVSVQKKPWTEWQPFLRKLFENEPTDQQYELAYKIWNHILNTANCATYIDTSDNLRLIRDFRGGTLPPLCLIDANTDPNKVFLLVNNGLFGPSDHPVTIYLQKEDMESAMWCLGEIGWTGSTYDANDYSGTNQMFF